MDRTQVSIYYFLEDIAHERFIKSLVERVITEESRVEIILNQEVLSARRGSNVKKEFRQFLKDYSTRGAPSFDVLVVVIDGNCKGHNDRIKELKKYIQPACPFKDKIVFAVPDPHIERWFILDQGAFKKGVGIEKAPPLPAYKCEKNYYKRLLIQTLKECDVTAQFGGAEYAERIVKQIKDIDILDRDPACSSGFKNFIQELRRLFKIYTK